MDENNSKKMTHYILYVVIIYLISSKSKFIMLKSKHITPILQCMEDWSYVVMHCLGKFLQHVNM